MLPDVKRNIKFKLDCLVMNIVRAQNKINSGI